MSPQHTSSSAHVSSRAARRVPVPSARAVADELSSVSVDVMQPSSTLDVDVSSSGWSGFCSVVASRLVSSIAEAIAAVSANTSLRSRLSASYTSSFNREAAYHVLIEALGLRDVRFDPLKARHTKGSTYHLFLKRLVGLVDTQTQQSCIAFITIVNTQQPTNIAWDPLYVYTLQTQATAPTTGTDANPVAEPVAPSRPRTRSSVASPSRARVSSTSSAVPLRSDTPVRRSLPLSSVVSDDSSDNRR